MPSDSETRIIIGADGTILAVLGSLPPGLLDRPLEECEELPHEVRAVGPALLDELRRSGGRAAVRTVTLDGGRGTMQLLAIEGLPLRRLATDVRALLTSKLDVISSQAADFDVTIHVHADAEVPPVVHVDAEKVAWAVTTLVGNALRYIQTRSRRTRGGTISVRAMFDPSRAELAIEVRDDGPGVRAETIEHLFSRGSLNVRGTGLALLLISDVCAAHGGAVEVRSSTAASDHGTLVRMTFATR